MKDKRGFTLVEIVVVIAVIGIMAAVLVPTFAVVINKANRSAAEQEATALRTGILAEFVGGTFDDYCKEFIGTDKLETGKSDIKISDTILTEAMKTRLSEESSSKFSDYISDVDGDITIKQGKFDEENTNVWMITYNTSKYTVTITADEIKAVDK